LQNLRHALLTAPLFRLPLSLFSEPAAEWCGPCKQLEPIIEAAVAATNGKVILGKIDTDANPELAQMLQIKSLPHVFGVFGGNIIDQFTGMKDPAFVKGFVDKLEAMAPELGPAAEDGSADRTPAEVAQEATAFLNEGKLDEARAVFNSVLDGTGLSATDPKASDQVTVASLLGVANCDLKGGDPDAALAMVAQITKDHPDVVRSSAQVSAVIAELEMAAMGAKGGSGDAGEADEEESRLRGAMEGEDAKDKATWDLGARVELVKFLVGKNQLDFDEPIELLLQVMRADKAFNPDPKTGQGEAQGLLIKIMDRMGPENPATKKARQRMTNILFI
jgi:putative thioredoxin